MKNLTVLEFLIEFKNIYTPLFNTEYNFSYKNLLNEIIINKDATSPINLGVITYQKQGVEDCLLIDGTQRIISFSLLLYALCECYKKTSYKNEESINKIHSRYLFSENKTKLQLPEELQFIYSKIINQEKLSDLEKKHPMFEMLHNFWEAIKIDKLAASTLFKEISGLRMLIEESEETVFNPRDLYCLLNLQTKKLNETELISHYLWEVCQKDINIWLDFIELFRKVQIEQCMEVFLRDFLTIYFKGNVPADNEIYLNFKKYYEQMIKYQTSEEVLKKIKKYATYYIKIIQADFEQFEVKKQITLINETHEYNIYPYLLEVLEDFENKKMDEKIFIEILTTINEFLRKKQEEKGLNINFNFATLTSEINKLIILNKKDTITINDLT